MRAWIMSLVAVVLAYGSQTVSVWAQEEEEEAPRRERKQERDREPQGDRERKRPDRPQDRPDRTDRPNRPDRPGREVEVDVEKVKEFLKENDPHQYEAIQEIQKKLSNKELGPDQREELMRHQQNMLRGVAHRMREMEEMKKRNPEEYERIKKYQKLERDSFELAEKARKAESGTDKGALKDKLKTVLSELFDLRETRRAQEVAELEKRLKELRDTLEKRKQGRDQIIERRMNEMMGKEDSMGW